MSSTKQDNYSHNNLLGINLAQKGIAYFPDFAQFATFRLKKSKREIFYKQWLQITQAIDKLCAKMEYKTVCICGVDYSLWNMWCDVNDMAKPKGVTDHQLMQQKPFTYSGGDFWFHIKGDNETDCHTIYLAIFEYLEADIQSSHLTIQAHNMYGGKVFGGQFIDGLVNPVNAVTLSENMIVGDEDSNYYGSAYVLQQKFRHNWSELENMIGRNHDDRSHIKCAHQVNGENFTQRIFRQALPYGRSDTGVGKEEGFYFVAYTKDGSIYEDLMRNIIGSHEGFVKDQMLNNTQAISGNFWFIPCAEKVGLSYNPEPVEVAMNDYSDVHSKNGLMYYNKKDFLHRAQKDGLEISNKIIILLSQLFGHWNDTWEKKIRMPALGHLKDYVEEPRWQQYQSIVQSPSSALRKGLAIKISLSDVLLRQQFHDEARLYNIKPYEIIVGNMPPLNLGSGTQVMEYLNEDEKIEAFFGMLNEYSATGHNVPDYKKLLRLGVKGLIEEATKKLHQANDEKRDFFQSVLWSLEGLRDFILSYATLAEQLKSKTAESAVTERQNYADIAQRMQRLAEGKPEGLLDAIQLIFITNCALHQIGEPMSIGRLDQYLIEPYQADNLTQAEAQEIIDAFWLKMDETVNYNRQFMSDYLTYGTGAVFDSAGNFPQGSALNQWMQQTTVGGYLPTESEIGEDGCNEITLMCLRSTRRLPLNAPCLSLRVHGKMDTPLHQAILSEAAKAILSGGIHPVLINDDKLVTALTQSGINNLADARDYTYDGYFEPIIGGKSEWAFSYVPVLPAVAMAMNQGATIEGAGWVHLRGLKSSWNSPPPEDIQTFGQFMTIFYTHYKWLISKFYNTLMEQYGNLWGVCPSPLFSALIDGCMESGRDMTNGGAKYHIVAPMMCGITNAINSLYVIKTLVYDEKTAITTLPELLQALWNNWGDNMVEPFHNTLAGQTRADDRAVRYQNLRQAALLVPKFGEGNSAELKAFAEQVVGRCVDIIHQGLDEKKGLPSIKKAYRALKKKYAIEGREFAFSVTPGVGTFEDNVGLGLDMGASADGRLAGTPIADDFSTAPSPANEFSQTTSYDVYQCLQDWNIPAINIGLSNIAPVDLNIKEDFQFDDMEQLIKAFAKGEIGSNMMTITTADSETYEKIASDPEKCDLAGYV
ncbi:pyruvate formate lyase family protein [Candidatus Albibeggiatoa sp. nov. NOAA]|uniref:pyruvate formate lyase family protein n=1 Tax=Candidatus Albibeggiatoa sp. nov. NOAA TaxID=3162724 RepID=UPI0032F64F6E|nr:Dyp-type peroxidase [Thiotrichaceae bacterium]